MGVIGADTDGIVTVEGNLSPTPPVGAPVGVNPMPPVGIDTPLVGGVTAGAAPIVGVVGAEMVGVAVLVRGSSGVEGTAPGKSTGKASAPPTGGPPKAVVTPDFSCSHCPEMVVGPA